MSTNGSSNGDGGGGGGGGRGSNNNNNNNRRRNNINNNNNRNNKSSNNSGNNNNKNGSAKRPASGGGRGGGEGGRGGGGGGLPNKHARGTTTTASSSEGRGWDDNNNNNNNNNMSRKDSRIQRKARKRAAQLAVMQEKADAEDAYFSACQREAMAAAVANNKNKKQKPNNDNNAANGNKKKNGKQQLNEAERLLFGTQLAQGINFDKYNEIKVEVKPQSKQKVSFEDFEKLQLPDGDDLGGDPLRRNIGLMRYKKPTPIQRHSIPLALAGDDLMCCAQTGSGKTCAFLLPIICSSLRTATTTTTVKATTTTQQSNNNKKNNNNHDKNGSQQQGNGNNNSSEQQRQQQRQSHQSVAPWCVVLAPTRELALQIELEAQKLTHNIPALQTVAIYGGANPRPQLRDLAFAGAASDEDSAACSNHCTIIVVATPGRLTDFWDRSIVTFDQVRFLVLDEADRMLDMGFEPQIRRLVVQSNMTPKHKRQTLLFSATFPGKIQTLAREFLRPSYTWIAVGRVGSTTENITQVLVKSTVDRRKKLKQVVEAIESGPEGRVLIFVQKKRTASWVKKQLAKGGPDDGTEDECFSPKQAVEIHGDRTQPQREEALSKFRSGACNIMVATDVAARGLDIGGVTHVIQMDLPVSVEEFDTYVHRIGRTGRAGHTGLATSLYVPGASNNANIAPQLLEQLHESGSQDIPTWLESECGGGGGGGGVRGATTNGGGSTDTRKNNSNNNTGRGRGGRGKGGPSNNSNGATEGGGNNESSLTDANDANVRKGGGGGGRGGGGRGRGGSGGRGSSGGRGGGGRGRGGRGGRGRGGGGGGRGGGGGG